MKVLVPIKRVPDYATRVKIRPDGTDIDVNGIKWIVNPFDEIAVEEALRQRDAGVFSEVEVVTVGPEDAQPQLRYALAMGANTAIHVTYNGTVDSDLAARILAEVFRRGDYGCVIMGKQSIDSDASQTPQLLAALLQLPQASFASKIQIADNSAEVTREVDGGLEVLKISLPCIISTDLRLNEPRYASLPGIMSAKKKPITVLDASELGIPLQPKIQVLHMAPPPKKAAGRKVGTVEELVSLLHQEAKVL